MKTTKILILVLFMIAIIVCVMSCNEMCSDEQTSAAHQHTWGEWVQIYDPSVEGNVIERRSCDGCDYFETKESEAPCHETVVCDTLGSLWQGIHYDTPTTRVHTDYIKVSRGMVIRVEGYKYAIHYYSSPTEDAFYKTSGWTGLHTFPIDEDCYIRVSCSYFFDADMTAGEASVEVGWCREPVNKTSTERPFILASHRGLQITETENTLVAFKAAAAAGFQYIETDVWWTLDEVPVLNHDGVVHGTSISAMTFEECQALGVCSLLEYLKVCKLYNITPLIELKASLNDARADDLYKLLCDMNMLDVIFVAFDRVDLMFMLNKYPFDVIWARGYGTVPTEEDLASFAQLYKSNNTVYWFMFAQDFHEEYYELFLNSGVKLAYGIANDTDTFYKWVGYCDMIMTDKLPPSVE